MTVTFDETTHRYTVDGEIVPSVTQLVAPLGDDYDEPDELLESAVDIAADRGVTMHAYIAHRLAGLPAEDFELPGIYEIYAQGVEQLLAEHVIVPLIVETPMPGVGFAGTPDLVCEFDGTTAVLDWKFVSQIAKSKVGAQLAGYQELCVHNAVFPEALYAVQFTREGSYRLYPVEPEPNSLAFTVCKHLHAIKTRKHPRGRIA